MNYLAHILFSGEKAGFQIGGFIADFVKGRKYQHFSSAIRTGVIHHRNIDTFTDQHHDFKEMVHLLRPTFGRYSSIIADMYLDHFLARHFSQFSRLSLAIFAFRFYTYALFYYFQLPTRVKRFIFHFIYTNRLMKYRSITGLQDSLSIMSRYKSQALEPQAIITYLEENYVLMEMLSLRLIQHVRVYAAQNERNLTELTD